MVGSLFANNYHHCDDQKGIAHPECHALLPSRLFHQKYLKTQKEKVLLNNLTSKFFYEI